MRTKKMPRALTEKLGEKLSFWLNGFATQVEEDEDFQENLFHLIDAIESYEIFDKEEQESMSYVIKQMISLSFITQKNREEIQCFYEEYNT